LAAPELAQIAIIDKVFTWKQLSEEEVEKVIVKTIGDIGSKNERYMG